MQTTTNQYEYFSTKNDKTPPSSSSLTSPNNPIGGGVTQMFPLKLADKKVSIIKLRYAITF